MGTTIRRLGECLSTQDEARALALSGEPEGTAVVADSQLAGRGTRGRTWFSPPRKGLYVTFILRPKPGPRLSLLPLAVGIAARDAVASIPVPGVRIKWPNDLVFDGKKLAGILCEGGSAGGAFPFVLAGIGINVDQGPEDFPQEIRARSISLRTASGGPVDREGLLTELCASLEKWYNLFSQGTGAEIIRAYEERMSLIPGETISLEAAGAKIEGLFIGLDASGGLVCEVNGRTTHYSAEVTGLEGRR